MDRNTDQFLLKPFEPHTMHIIRAGGLQHNLENYLNRLFFRNPRGDPDNRIRDPIC